ncbi:MAG TPA: TlpA disulfide reductase family protein [Candidatus Limnocylindrales bacterium]|nr:TlpA disulfide reductase family protein [Candidatus Limnocylindrales bacterium]
MAAVVAVVAVVAFLVGQNLGRPGSNVIVVESNPLIGQPAPDFRLATVDGQELALSDLRGRPVIVNFWASWCIPCRDEFPVLRAARESHADDDLEIIGVVHDDGPQTAADFADAYGATWPMVVDTDDVAWNAYRGVFLPLSYFIDRDGIVRAVSYGPPPADALEAYIDQIL